MIRPLTAVAGALALAACTQVAPPRPIAASRGPIEVQILAFNDFHGNLQTPDPIEVTEPDGSKHKIVTGGAAHLAATLAGLRAGHSNTITVSAGDTIGASPLISANYLDEPTIDAMNLLHLEINSPVTNSLREMEYDLYYVRCQSPSLYAFRLLHGFRQRTG